jgi:hypothetical protein
MACAAHAITAIAVWMALSRAIHPWRCIAISRSTISTLEGQRIE